MEIVTGLWIGSYHLLNNVDWCKEKKNTNNNELS